MGLFHGFLFCLAQLLFQPFHVVVGKFDAVKLLPCLLKILEDISAGCAVLPAEPVDGVESCFDLLQFLGGVCEGIPAVPEAFGGILNLVHEVLHPLVELGQGIVEPGDAAHGPLSLGHQTGGTVGFVGAVEAFDAFVDGVGKLLGVLQNLPPGFEGVILTGFQIGPGDLVDLKTERFHPAELLSLVHGELGNLPAELGNNLKSFLIIQMQLLVVSKCIQKVQMIFFIKQCGAVVLTVDVDQLQAKLM